MTTSDQEYLRPLLSEIHRYWFGSLRSPMDLPQDKKDMWFKQSDLIDTHIREHFGQAIPAAAAIDWDLKAIPNDEQVALVVLLDQFPRNVFRNSPQAYEYDDTARAIAARLQAENKERFALIERIFLAIPFEHSEAIADQDFSVWLMAGIAVEAGPALQEYVRWALDSFVAHRNLIRRFGRFPHRNVVLGRRSTEDELAFLSEQPPTNPSNPTEGAILRSRR